MKYLKKFQLLESNLIDLRDWEDFKDLIQSEILDEWDIPVEGGEELSNVRITSLSAKPGNLSPVAPQKVAVGAGMSDLDKKKMLGTSADAPLCRSCGNITLRNGTCYMCPNCGTTTGCS